MPTSEHEHPSELGQQLKAERVRQAFLLSQVASRIRVREEYLDAIERHNWDALPGPVFTRGFIQSYAQFLSLDTRQILNAYARQLRISRATEPTTAEAEQEATKAILERLARTQGRDHGTWWKSRGMIVLGLVACAVVALWFAPRLPATPAEARSLAGVTSLPEMPSPAEEPSTAEEPPPAEALVPSSTTSSPASPMATDGESPPPPATTPVESSAPTTAFGSRLISGPPSAPAPAPAPAVTPMSLPDAGAAHGDSMPSADAILHPHEGRLTVPDFGVGTGVSDRQLVGRSDQFAEGVTVWFWTRVLDGHKGDTVRHVWIHEGREVGTVELSVGGPQWRTQSHWRLDKGSSGTWSVEARDADDRVLATTSFRCGSDVDTAAY